MCYPGYTGQFCHIKINYCLSQPCENGGICASTATDFSCTCPSNYTGSTCSILNDSCATPPCLNYQTHICPTGLANPPECMEDIDECLLNQDLCKNEGQCVNDFGTYHCQCHPHYQGDDCSIPIDPCLSNPCIASNAIACSSTTSNSTWLNYTCTCRVGFTGWSIIINFWLILSFIYINFKEQIVKSNWIHVPKIHASMDNAILWLH